MVDKVEVPADVTGPDAPEEVVVEQASEETQERPDWLPEKFTSPEELSKAYGELEAKLSQPSPDRTEPEPIDKPSATDTEQVEEVLAERGLNFEEMSEEYRQANGLSEERYSQLEAAGIPRDIVDQFITGQQAVGRAVTQEAESIVGGSEGYQDMISWAANSLPENEIDHFNNSIQSNNRVDIINAVRSLHSRYSQENGIQPNLTRGSSTPDTGNIYQSWSQVTQDMAQPEYKADPAFRAAVEDKLARSGELAS